MVFMEGKLYNNPHMCIKMADLEKVPVITKTPAYCRHANNTLVISSTRELRKALNSPMIYLRFLALWGIVLMADYLLDFRFEFLWPFWLLLRSVYDSFKYQGLAFSVLFVCVAATSDIVCIFFIPVHWLFFLASTYVWVQYVWHTEKGICLPTVVLCILFVYVEAAVRMRDLKQPPFHVDLCRPFAAHCIGYPVVTFGFGFKSYVGYRMRQRRQREVAKENEFYMELLQQSLPPRPESPAMPTTVAIISTLSDKSSRVVCITPNEPDGKLPNGLVVNGVAITPSITNGSATIVKNNQRKIADKGPERDRNDSESRKTSHTHTNGSLSKPDDKKSPPSGSLSKPGERVEDKKSQANGSVSKPDDKRPPANVSRVQDRPEEKKVSTGSPHPDLDYTDRVPSVNDLDLNEPDKEKGQKGWNNRSQDKSGKGAGKLQEQPANCLKEKKGRINKDPPECNNTPVRDEHISRLEADVKRLKADLQASRQTELELRGQAGASAMNERAARTELAQLQGINDDLANRVHGLVAARQADKQNLLALEKKLGEERRVRAGCEAQLAAERKNKRQEESALQAMASALNKAECTESCRQRRRELEADVKVLRRELKNKEERLGLAERELQTLRQYKETQSDTEILMSALSAMQEKNVHLENSLKAETRIKLDLFSALGEAKRQLEIRENVIRSQDKELDELKGKMAQVLAVMPSESFCSSPPALQTTSKFRCFSTVDEDFGAVSNLRTLAESPVSTLDPNATAYTPKGNMVTSTEA